MHTQAPMHRSEEPKKGQEDFLEEVSSKLSATRKKDTASSEEGRILSREYEEVKRWWGQSTMLEKRTRAQPTLLKQA